MSNPKTVRIAAIADLHVDAKGGGYPRDMKRRSLFEQIAERADIALLCGDLTDFGLAEEARILADELADLTLPILAVLGNHDFESGQQDEVVKIMEGAGVHMLDGQAHVEHGVGFAGVKGFGGGFGTRTLEPWGEPAIKVFVQDALDETLKLERALSRLHTVPRVALLHYAPIAATLEGEPPELFAFLGSGRLEEPLNRYGVKAVFHGHAHHGSPEGATREGIPVFNVSLSLLKRHGEEGALPVRFFEMQVEERDA